MRKSLPFILFALPAIAGATVWTEAGGGPWIPFFGAFSTNHNPGVQVHLRAGTDISIQLPDFLTGIMPFTSEGSIISPFVEVYHTWNSLKEQVWETRDGDTVKSGNMYYIGIGSKLVLNRTETYSFGTSLSLGLVTEYAPTGENIVGGGSHSPPKFTPSVFLGGFATYEALKPLYIFVEYQVESLGDFSGGFTGWHEISLGAGVRF